MSAVTPVAAAPRAAGPWVRFYSVEPSVRFVRNVGSGAGSAPRARPSAVSASLRLFVDSALSPRGLLRPLRGSLRSGYPSSFALRRIGKIDD